MSSEAGPSKPKNIVYNEMHENDDEYLFGHIYDENDFWNCEESSESSEGEEDLDLDHPLSEIQSTWSTIEDLQSIAFDKLNAFSGQPTGLNPIDYFNFFFDHEFLQMICNGTNAQAKKLLSSEHAKETPRFTAWKELTVEELKIFLGLVLHTGSISLERLDDYWIPENLGTSIPIFPRCMEHNRFLDIMRCLHFNAQTESNDPLYKIRDAIDYFNKKMGDCYYPGKHLSLEKSIVLQHGILHKRYIRNRLYKHAIKLYMLTEPDGLALRFCVYTGRKDTEIGGTDHVKKVVLKLLEPYLNCGHSVYMSKFYNSYGLTKNLLEKKTYCTGLLKKNLKDNPMEVVKAKLNKGRSVSKFCQGVQVGKWKGVESEVLYITSEYPNQIIPVANKRGRINYRPIAYADYNKYMSDIVRQNEIFYAYPCYRNTLRWHLKVAIHIFQLLFVNSYKIYNKYSGQPKKDFRYFRFSVINTLLYPNPSTRPSVESSDICHMYNY